MTSLRLVIWSATSALAGFLFGFDTVVISGAEQTIQTLWHLSAGVHGIATAAALYGTVVGSVIGGWPADRFGRRPTLLSIGILYFVSAVWSALAQDVYSFIVARFVGGLGIGISTVVAPLYIAEIAPAEQRGRLAGMFQFNIVFGILVAFLSNAWLAGIGDHAWRWMLGVAAFPALLYTALCFIIPESPRWLIGRKQDRASGLAVLGMIHPGWSVDALARKADEIAQASLGSDSSGRFWTMTLGVLHGSLRHRSRVHLRLHRRSRRGTGRRDLGVHLRDFPQPSSGGRTGAGKLHALDLRGAADDVLPEDGGGVRARTGLPVLLRHDGPAVDLGAHDGPGDQRRLPRGHADQAGAGACQQGARPGRMMGTVLGIGEVLWDLLPSGPQLGGALANFAFHVAGLGIPAAVVTRVGQDAYGDAIRTRFSEMRLPGELIQGDSTLPTGTVSVTLSPAGVPDYTIHEPAAWDRLAATPEALSAMETAAAVCFGSLAQRSGEARQAIQRLVTATPRAAWRIFDVNLRQHYYDRAVVEASLEP